MVAIDRIRNVHAVQLNSHWALRNVLQIHDMLLANSSESHQAKTCCRYLQIRFNATEAARADRGLQEKRVNDASVVNVVCESLHIHRGKFLAPD